MAKETAGGVGLLGFDVPAIVSAEEDHLRVIAAVECRDADVAPPLVAVVVRDQVCVSARLPCPLARSR